MVPSTRVGDPRYAAITMDQRHSDQTNVAPERSRTVECGAHPPAMKGPHGLDSRGLEASREDEGLPAHRAPQRAELGPTWQHCRLPKSTSPSPSCPPVGPHASGWKTEAPLTSADPYLGIICSGLTHVRLVTWLAPGFYFPANTYRWSWVHCESARLIFRRDMGVSQLCHQDAIRFVLEHFPRAPRGGTGCGCCEEGAEVGIGGGVPEGKQLCYSFN
jgi:hypothetical protein